MPVYLEPDDRDGLRDHVMQAIDNTLNAVVDPQPEDLAEAVIETLERLDIIAAVSETRPERRNLQLANELDAIVVRTTHDGQPDVTLRWSIAQAEQVHAALPLHINYARSYADHVLGKEG